MIKPEDMAKDMDRQIDTAHKRFQKVMKTRLPRMSLESKERYFAILSSLVSKLEDREKPIRDVLRELMAEAAPYVLQEIQ